MKIRLNIAIFFRELTRKDSGKDTVDTRRDTQFMSYRPHAEKLNRTASKRPHSWIAAFIVTAATLIISSGTAYAGLFSFLAPLIEGSPAAAQTIRNSESDAASREGDSNSRQKDNLQKLALLHAAANTDPNPNKSAEVAPIDGGKVLVADIAISNEIKEGSYNTSINTYEVRDGDTVSGIAKMFNVSVSTVLWANNLTSKSLLKPGQTLVILPVSGISYKVAKGDTLGGIAKKYKADPEDILNYNDIRSASSLAVGQTIIIPNAELSAADAAKSSSSGTIRGINYPSYAGYYIRPISGGRKSQGIHGHNAVDLAAPVGTPIVASAAGTVIISRTGTWSGGYGNYVVISHGNGTQTLYSHMLKNTVSVGEKVDQGETIGYIGMTGNTTGPHIHFEIRGGKNPF